MAQTTSLVFNGGAVPSPAPTPSGSGKAKLLKTGEITITEQGVQVTKKVICDPDSVTPVAPFMEVLTSAKLAELVNANSILVLAEGDMQYLMANASVTVEDDTPVCTSVNFLGLSKENKLKVAYECTRITDELTFRQVVEVGEPVETNLKRVAFTGSYNDLEDTNVVFIERLTAEYSEITGLLRNNRVIMTTDGYIYCGYGDNKYYFIQFKNTGHYGAMFEMSSVDTDNHWVSASSDELLDSNFWRLAFASGDRLNIALDSYNHPYLTQCPLYQTTEDASSFTEGTYVANVPNNKLTFITNLLVPNLEIRAYLECYDVPSEHVANFAVEVTPTVDCTVTVKTSKNSYATPHWITLCRASGVSNVMRAGHKYQITCIGTCWTIAEFELPS